jgi:hypothetical protein
VAFLQLCRIIVEAIASKREYIRSFMNSASIIMLQEHWLSDGQLYLLGDISDSFLYAGVSGFDNSEVLIGRPYGGCAILWRSDLAVTVKVKEYVPYVWLMNRLSYCWFLFICHTSLTLYRLRSTLIS